MSFIFSGGGKYGTNSVRSTWKYQDGNSSPGDGRGHKDGKIKSQRWENKVTIGIINVKSGIMSHKSVIQCKRSLSTKISHQNVKSGMMFF